MHLLQWTVLLTSRTILNHKIATLSFSSWLVKPPVDIVVTKACFLRSDVIDIDIDIDVGGLIAVSLQVHPANHVDNFHEVFVIAAM